MTAFQNEPLADFSDSSQRTRFASTLEQVRRECGWKAPCVIGGQPVVTGRGLPSGNPAHPSHIVGQAALARSEEVDRAIACALRAQARWARTPVETRAELLQSAAARLRQQRAWFAALAVLEVGKPWREADADVVEAIDFLDYYRAGALELAQGKAVIQQPGESNRYGYVPRGVCAVIAPWNFPVGILAGMASSALAAGNVVIVKPAEQSPILASFFVRLLHEAGVPEDVLQYLPGLGEETGRALVEDPRVALVMFTGSKAVGLSILRTVGNPSAAQRFVKHAVVEMGGKNAIVVDEDADLDEAIHGVLISAFGYQGQKCSAASRLIVHAALYDRLVERLIPAVAGLRVCDPIEPRCDLGPLIDADAKTRVTTAVAEAAASSTCLYRSPPERLPAEGFFCGPALCAEVDPRSPLAQEELFGPVVCLFRVRSFSEGLALANDTAYGLTGGVYSRSPSHLKEAIDSFQVGNLYLNRPITGSLVGRQPFGGAKLSGLGTKAGGPDYLLQLVVPKTICENTTRHGIPLE